MEILKAADIIYLDPDNGIQPKNMDESDKNSIKYALYREIRKYYSLGKTVIVYNHYDRSPLDKYKNRIYELKKVVPESKIEVIKFKRYFIRHYVFLVQDKHTNLIEQVIDKLTNNYGYLFSKGF